ncbi:MAG: hypothetical protein MJA83_20080 [Gammaproteobacteria bacterium]|nr:hypothetical protein [Gammaproteobacteria bacterium]
MQKYTKAILAFAGVLLPFLEQVGVPLPPFLTLDWLQGVILAATPVLVYFFPNTDKQADAARIHSPPTVGLLALVLACLTLAGCAGTRAAYQAAEGLEETAKVFAEHYFAEVRELNDLDDAGALTPSMKQHAQDIVRRTRPVILQLSEIAQAYKNVRSAENEAALRRAVNEAALALSRLIDVAKAAGRGQSSLQKGRSFIRDFIPLPV